MRRARRKRTLASPTVFSIRELLELSDGRHAEELHFFLETFEGSCVSLGWPPQSIYTVCASLISCSMTDIDLEHCQSSFFGEFRRLQVLGIACHANARFPLLLDDYGTVYCYEMKDDCMYALANSVESFLAKGLIRCDSVHEALCLRLCLEGATAASPQEQRQDVNRRCRASERERYLYSLAGFAELLRCEDVIATTAYVQSHLSVTIPLTWPEKHVLVLANSKQLDLTMSMLRKLQKSTPIKEPVNVLGFVEAMSAAQTFFRHIRLFQGDSGTVYAGLPRHDKLTPLARNLKEFVRVGLSPLIGDYRYENIGTFDLTRLQETYPDARLPLKKRRILIGHFESLNSLYIRGQPKFSAPWRALRDVWTFRCRKTRIWKDGMQLQRFVRVHAGRWLPLAWPPMYGFMIGDCYHFGAVFDRKTYRRFSCFRDCVRLYCIGFVSAYERLPDVSVSPQVIVSENGHVFAYAPQEDKAYLLGLTFNEFFEHGLGAMYSYFERPFVDEATENQWYRHSFTSMSELSNHLGDRRQMVRFCHLNAGCKVRLGGPQYCVFTFGSWNASELDEPNLFVFNVLERAGFTVVGWLEPSSKAVFLDGEGAVYVSLYGIVLVKLGETLRGFIRHGSFWLRYPRRFCFLPIGSTRRAVSTRVTVSCDLQEYVVQEEDGKAAEAADAAAETTTA
ncbi:protein UL29 [Aotine betaherpesvirus 1]|uniref:Protein UL29 n=1 Tax=Aotine betaherpesvirus 1 TaxID=50290 RepID=G8XUA4_9BETA|nr:protein UL29 [Aotine betaherpesvirus 1]AEV80735.1 protein UL29 [Aotine betaherpesvirus 1]